MHKQLNRKEVLEKRTALTFKYKIMPDKKFSSVPFKRKLLHILGKVTLPYAQSVLIWKIPFFPIRRRYSYNLSIKFRPIFSHSKLPSLLCFPLLCFWLCNCEKEKNFLPFCNECSNKLSINFFHLTTFGTVSVFQMKSLWMQVQQIKLFFHYDLSQPYCRKS